MLEVGHFTLIIFVLFILLISIFITIANLYYFNDVYKQGGTPNYSSDSAYNMTIVLFMALILEVLCFIGLFYVLYEEYERASKKGTLELQLERYKSSVDAINKTYSQTSKNISHELQVQLDKQIRRVSKTINAKDFVILKQERELYEKNKTMEQIKQENRILEDRVYSLSDRLDLPQDNTKVINMEQNTEPNIPEQVTEPNTPESVTEPATPEKNIFSNKKSKVTIADNIEENGKELNNNTNIQKKKIQEKNIFDF